MKKSRIKIYIVGQPPPDLDVSKISNWKSDIWLVDDDVESLVLNQNADSADWAYSDLKLKSTVPRNKNYDFTVCLLNVPLEDNYYTRRLEGNVICFTFFEVGDILRFNNIPIENVVLRLLYAYSLILKRCDGNIPPTKEFSNFTHDEARGCLYDMNGIKHGIVLSCDNPILCESCKARSLEDGASREFTQILEEEIKRIRKDAYDRIADTIKKHPVAALVLSLVVAFLINLASSFVYDFLRQYRSDSQASSKSVLSVRPVDAAQGMKP